MKRHLQKSSVLLPLLATSLYASSGVAQGDIDKPLPNVMMLVDTSGSMEWKAEASTFPTCNPGNPNAKNEKSRWIELVEVMTGSFEKYSCFPMDRSSAAFVSEFSLNGNKPYDWGYINPYHRVVSNNCTVGPGVLPDASNPYSFPDKSFNTFTFTAPNQVTRPNNLSTHTGCAGFSQAPDGILDVFKEKVRFGLMTFDSHVSSKTGLAANGSVDYQGGIAGTWSYFLDDSPVTGRPAQCSLDQPQEVGARNAAAPPWEGRMVGFGPATATAAVIDQRNEFMQKVMLATRPYGATPMAGLLHDAREYYWHDDSKDPLDLALSPADFGPRNDPSTKVPECRRNLLILLSDGEPNLDLRTSCENVSENGKCPYQRPEEIAWDLLHNPVNDPDQTVETIVIGFALDKVRPGGGAEVSCAELTDQHCANAAESDRALNACCTLNKIAAAGGRPNPDGTAKKAYFPQDGKELRRTFSRILSDITTSLTTRTSAAYSAAGASAADGSHQFSSSFTPVLEQPWRGNLTRTRIQCKDGVPEEQPVEASEGDDFAANLNSGSGPARRFVTFLAASSSRNSLRPYLTQNNDGLGLSGGTQTTASTATEFVPKVSAALMEVDGGDCSGGTAVSCRDAILGWTVGLTNSENESRCRAANTPDCNLFGAIYHSTPRIVPGRPNEFLRDESYQAFAEQQIANERPTVLYTSTADGMLHAFKTADQSSDPEKQVRELENNELWAFLPPAVLPVLQAQYPTTPATLLDGVPIVKDVPATVNGTVVTLDRTAAEAQSGVGAWRTALVQGFGKGQVGAGYFALDITNPVTTSGGPRFLWQLTRDGSGNPLFGTGGTPLITTVFLKRSANDAGTEVSVAVLPGGDAGSRTGEQTLAGPLMLPEDDRFEPKEFVNEYSGALSARSLTIVRLDTGEIVRTFRPELVSPIATGVTTLVDIPTPIVGQPAAFPAAPGAVADRVFVGDRDGRLWRVDLSNSDPDEWEMSVFFDAYFDQDRSKRQPIETPPILSVNEIGQITVAMSTGEQGVQTAEAGQINRVVSLTEVLDDSKAFRAKVNWIQTLGCAAECKAGENEGERVTGPMSLFGQSLYFASSAPASADATECGTGSSRVWGVHYKTSLDEFKDAETIDPMNGPTGMLPPPPMSTTLPKSTELTPGVIFGVSIEQQPTCSTESESFDQDPLLGGFGEHTSLSAVNPGKFFLVFQTGGVLASSGNKVSTTKVELQPPPNSVRIDSWAPIFE